MVRLFVALPIPEELNDIISSVTNGLAGARWVKAESYHLTLRFVGEVDGDMADDLEIALSRINVPPMALQLDGLGYFQKRGMANNLHIRIKKTDALERLQRKVEVVCVRSGLKAEQRKFLPHITLARMKTTPEESAVKFIAERDWPDGLSFQADHFILYSSFLSGEGAIYTPEVEYDLKV